VLRGVSSAAGAFFLAPTSITKALRSRATFCYTRGEALGDERKADAVSQRIQDGSSEAETLGALLRRERTARGMSQSQLAALAGTDKSRISRIERGDVEPTVAMVVRLATGLGIEPGELFPKVLPPPDPTAPDPELVADLERYHDRARLRALRSGLHRMLKDGTTPEEVAGVLRALGPGIAAGMYDPNAATGMEEAAELSLVLALLRGMAEAASGDSQEAQRALAMLA
jgi:transcriptional regulator with XRE-family HTH domain